MTSQAFFSGAFAGYLLACLAALAAFATGRVWLRRGVIGLGWLSLLAHLLGLGIRWYEGGQIEVLASERALGRTLEGFERFSAWLGHPPFTNLYESLVFFAFALVLAGLIAERVWKARAAFPLTVAAMVLANLSMGLASLQLQRDVTPLVPALQSWWLHIHVITAFLGYACFFLAAVAGVLHLRATGISDRALGLAALAAGSLAILGAAGGVPWSPDRPMTVPVLVDAGSCRSASDCRGVLSPYRCQNGACVSETSCDAGTPCPGEHRCREGRCRLQRTEFLRDREGRTVRAELPAATVVAALALLLALLAAAAHLPFAGILPRWVPKASLAAFLLLLFGAGLTALLEGGSVALGGGGFLSLRSAPYPFALWLLGLLIALFLGALIAGAERLRQSLPEAETLDRMVARAIQAGFPLMTLTIVTGAVWADYSWGRPWGWDPKETWSLITWLVYAAYLHARITHGWRGRRAVLIAILGFLVVAFTFLGVNLGLTGSGLHTYGSAGD